LWIIKGVKLRKLLIKSEGIWRIFVVRVFVGLPQRLFGGLFLLFGVGGYGLAMPSGRFL